MRLKLSVCFVVGLSLLSVLLFSFATLATGRPPTVVVWTYCADYGEEWAHVKSAIAELLIKNEDYIIETSTTNATELGELLADADVLLIPEQEGCSEEELRLLGESWRSTLTNFLNGGGRVIAMSYGPGGIHLLQGAGLTTASPLRNLTGPELEIVPGERTAPHGLLRDVPSRFHGEDGTESFSEVDGTPLVVVAPGEEWAGEVVVFAKTLGQGSIIVMGFDFYKYNEAMARLLTNVVDYRSAWAGIPLPPNQPLDGVIAAGGVTEPEETQYQIQVPPETKVLAIAVQAKGNIDAHIKAGAPVQFSDGTALADLSLTAPDGSEFIIISERQLTSGTYFIAVENHEDEVQTFSITAIAIPIIYETADFIQGTIAPPSLPQLLPYVQTDKGQLGLQQCKVVVPEGATRLEIRLTGVSDSRVDLHVRYGRPVEVSSGQVVADLSGLSLSAEKALVISGWLLNPGVYYIAVEGLAPPQEFSLMITVGG